MEQLHDTIMSTRQLAVGYQGHALVQGIELTLRPGEIMVLIGPNGSGKTTLLKTIAGQLAPVGGVVWLAGKTLPDLSGKELAQKLALVLTMRLRTDRMTCEEVVAGGRYPYTGRLGLLSGADRDRVTEAMELVHTLELRSADFNAISDGQRQRVLLARAICQEPQVMVLDEPTSFLDIKYQLELLSVLKTMAREKRVAVLVSLHELALAQKLADTVVCVKNGRIERIGAPETILTDEYVRHLYDLQDGTYHAAFGSLELAAPVGRPRVFVIAGGGSGIPVFRRLQRQGIPFAVGVLHKNDLDAPLANILAVEVILAEAFEPIRPEQVEAAKKVLGTCQEVICCLEQFGSYNRENRSLLEEARRLNIPIRQVSPDREGASVDGI